RGLIFVRAEASTWSTGVQLGGAAIVSDTSIAVTAAGNGGVVWADVTREIFAYPITAGVPSGSATTTIAASTTSAIRPAVLPGDSLEVAAYIDNVLREYVFRYEAATQSFVLEPPLEIAATASDRFEMQADVDGRVTVVWYAMSKAWVRRKLGGVWQPIED